MGRIRFLIFFVSALFAHDTNREIFTDEFLRPIASRLKPISSEAFYSLRDFCMRHGVFSVVDLGCGESPQIGLASSYSGVDIVPEILEKNRKRFPDAPFFCLDCTEERIPDCELVFSHGLFSFFSFCDIGAALKRIKESGARYLVAETYSELDENQDAATGIFHRINFEKAPFSFPQTLIRIPDHEEEGKFLAVWGCEDLDLVRLTRSLCPPLTLLTKPVGDVLWSEHQGVVNSAKRGLKRVHPDYTFNPDRMEEVKENVVVISDLRAGLQAYRWKEEGRIQSLCVGPNFSPSEGDFFIAYPFVDCFLCPSQWPLENMHRFNPELKRYGIWYAGVDESFWKPTVRCGKKKSNRVLLYQKSNPELCCSVEEVLEAHGYSVRRVVYGTYKPEEFRTWLDECLFAVFVSKSESQGIALAESWCMDVPTLVWNPKKPFRWDRYVWEGVSSCPYLDAMNGVDWVEIEDLIGILHSFSLYQETFQPRRWVLLTMTDKRSIEVLMGHVRNCL